jgi:hypothetical protein
MARGKKDIQAMQEAMRRRQARTSLVGSTADCATATLPAPQWNPIDYSQTVEYSGELAALQYFPRINGVYLLAEGGRYYVGQSVDVYARFSSHRLRPICCEFTDPRGAVLAAVPLRDDWTWGENLRVRLNAEARFVAAALSLDLPLTNTLSAFKRDKLRRLFPDISQERCRVENALKILC